MKQWLVLFALILGVGLIATPLPAADTAPAVAGITNLAATANGGHIIAYSSQARDENGQIMPEWQASNLIDGQYVVGNFIPAESYGWSSQAAPSEEDPEWIIFAFEGERPRLIGRIVIDPATADPPVIGRWARNITVAVSTTTPDGPYETVGRFLVVNKPLKQAFDFPATEAKYVRLLITSNHGSDKCVELGEVEIYEAIVTQSSLDQLIVRLENLLTDLKKYRDSQLYRQQQQILEEVTSKPPAPITEAEPAASESPPGPSPEEETAQ